MKSPGKKMNYLAIAAASLLVVAIFTTLTFQNRQLVNNADKGDIGKTALFVRGIQSPQGLALDSKGRIFTQSAYDGKISMVNKEGQAFDYTYLKGYYGHGFEMDNNDNILMAAVDEVTKFDAFGRIIQSFQGFKNAYDIEVAPDNTIFVSDSQQNKIYEISPEGTITVFTSFGGLKSSSMPNVTGIRFDKDFKNLYCVNMYTGDLYRISLSSNYQVRETEIIASRLNKPNFIDIDVEGNLYITCLGDNTVVRVDQNSIVELIDTNGKLSAPSGIVFDSTDNESVLYVASRDTNSIYKIDIGIKNKAKK